MSDQNCEAKLTCSLWPPRHRYPSDKKNKNGKLRLLYECAPMSMIAEQAGGKGSTGTSRVMEVEPTAVCPPLQDSPLLQLYVP